MQAEQTRAVVIAAASRVFAERGWIAANMRDVARAAGVSVETLYAGFGSKAGLLKVALDVAIVGDDEPVPFAQRAEAIAMSTGPTVAARARTAAQVVTAINVRIHQLDQALRQGAAVEAVLAERLAEGEASRRAAIAGGAAQVSARPVTKGEVDELAVLASSVVYGLLVQSTGWSNAEYERWLAGRFVEVIRRNKAISNKEPVDEDSG
jgi:AcrR family transcriptional regulator